MPTYDITEAIKAQLRTKEGNQHHLPHIHVKYQSYKAVFYLDGTLKKGSMPPQEVKRIRAWIKENRRKLLKQWESLRREENAKS